MTKWPWNRTRRRLESRLDAADDRLRGIAAAVSGAAESQGGALAALRRQVEAIPDRLEFVRREILFEFHHGPRRREHEDVAWRIVDQKRYDEAAQAGLRLNIGCGHIPMDGYINIDARVLPGVDVIADVAHLQLAPNSVAEIYAAHLLEHFPQEQLRRQLLPHWLSLLAPQGKFRAIVPDGEAMIAATARGEMPYDDFREVLFGGQDYGGDYHYNMFTPDSLTKLFLEAGFRNAQTIVRGRQNGKCMECEVAATK